MSYQEQRPVGIKGWINELSKEQLAQRMSLYGLSVPITLDEMRKTMREYVDQNADQFTRNGGASVGLSNRPEGLPPPLVTDEDPLMATKIIDQMRKWGCYFDGRDPVAFLERGVTKKLPIFQRANARRIAGTLAGRSNPVVPLHPAILDRMGRVHLRFSSTIFAPELQSKCAARPTTSAAEEI